MGYEIGFYVCALLLGASSGMNLWLWRHLFDAEETIAWKDYALDCQLRDKAELLGRINDLENR